MKAQCNPIFAKLKNKYVAMDALILYFGVGRAMVGKWIKDGCPCIKIGRTYRFVLQDVESWLIVRTRREIRNQD